MIISFWTKRLSFVTLLALLASCGGGGGEDSSSKKQTSELKPGVVAVASSSSSVVQSTAGSNGIKTVAVDNPSAELKAAQPGQVLVFEASPGLPLGMAGRIQSLATTTNAGTTTTTLTITPVSVTDIFKNLSIDLTNVGIAPKQMVGRALRQGVQAYTRSTPVPQTQAIGLGELGQFDIGLTQIQGSAVGVDFSQGLKATWWIQDKKWNETDPGGASTKVDLALTGQIELENPRFSEVKVLIEDGKLTEHQLTLDGTLKRNVKLSASGAFDVNASELGKLFATQPTGLFFTKNGTFNEITPKDNGVIVSVHGVEKDPSKILIGAAILAPGVVAFTAGNSQTGNTLKTIPIGIVVTFFLTADLNVEAEVSLGYQWRDLDISAGEGLSYNDSDGLPWSLATGEFKAPTALWSSTAHTDQQEGFSYEVKGSAQATLTAGFDAGLVIAGLEISQSTFEGGLRGQLSGQFSKDVSQPTASGCWSNAQLTAGFRSLMDIAAGVEIKSDFTSKWVKWLNTDYSTGFVYRFNFFPTADEAADWLGQTPLWQVSTDTCHNPQFSVAPGVALYEYKLDAGATGFQPIVSSYAWDFGDGTSASGATASHVYAAPGDYTATLTVLFSDGIQRSSAQKITVARVPAISAAFSANLNGLQATFDAGISIPFADLTDFAWDFGDGTSATGATATHNYTSYGGSPWSVTLVVHDKYGRTATSTQILTATPPPAVSSVTVAPTSPAVGSTATFSVGGTNLKSGYVLAFPGCSPNELTSSSTTLRQFTCTLGVSGSLLTGTVNTQASTVLYTFSLSVAPSGGGGVATPSIASGGDHTLALGSDGSVWAWGGNLNGQLGNGSFVTSATPTQVLGSAGVGKLSGVQAIAAGRYHSLALKSDGTVWAWGTSSSGALGNNGATDSRWPVQVLGPGGISVLTDVVAISAGYNHSLALKRDGTVWAWGSNAYGMLGNNDNQSRGTPVQVLGVDGAGFLVGVKAVAAGSFASYAVLADGTVLAWGQDQFGSLGIGSTISLAANRLVPIQVHGPAGSASLGGVVDIAASNFHATVIRDGGSLLAWGNNQYGAVGDGSTIFKSTPVQVLGPQSTGQLTGAVGVAVGAYHSLACMSDGSVWAWGYGLQGELGNGVALNSLFPQPVTNAGGAVALSGAAAVASGDYHGVALKHDGTIWTWGANNSSQLGNGATSTSLSPVQVVGANGVGFLNLGPR